MNSCMQQQKAFFFNKKEARYCKNCYKYILTVSKFHVMSRWFVEKEKTDIKSHE